MKQVTVPRSLAERLPKPFARHIIAAARRALAQGMPAPMQAITGPYTTVMVPDDLAEAITQIAPHRGGLSQYLAAAIIYSGTQPIAMVAHIKPHATYEPIPPTPTYTKAQAAWWAEIHRRVALTKMDGSLGKYARLFITAGSPAVNMYRADGDFFDEIQAGIVVRDTLTCELEPDEIMAWRNSVVKTTGKIVTWAYIDGECEALIVAHEATMRGHVRMTSPEEVERMVSAEMLQVKEFGTRADFLKLAGKDLLRLGGTAPDHVLKLGRKLELISGAEKNLLTAACDGRTLAP